MASNSTLRKAMGSKKDEFWTQYEDIKKEVSHYKDQMKGATVWCPCDDYSYSNFCKFYQDVKEEWGIKKLIFTSYPNGKCRIIDDTTTDTVLNGDGDYNSDECDKFFQEADIISTNPPFSKFEHFMTKIIDGGKKFLILGGGNSITNKEIFIRYFNKKIWLGYERNEVKWFEVPEGYEYEKEVDGKKFGKVSGISWWTNLKVDKFEKPFETKYNLSDRKYEKFTNFDALNIDRTEYIPMDYDGLMGVPVTYINKHDDRVFDLVGLFNGYAESEPEKGLYCGELVETWKNGKMTKTRGPAIGTRATYTRLLIKKKKN